MNSPDTPSGSGPSDKASGMEPQQASFDPTEKTIHEEPHDDHWGTWNDRIYICGEEPKKGIGISDGCVCHVMPIKRWLELAEENAKLLREREELIGTLSRFIMIYIFLKKKKRGIYKRKPKKGETK